MAAVRPCNWLPQAHSCVFSQPEEAAQVSAYAELPTPEVENKCHGVHPGSPAPELGSSCEGVGPAPQDSRSSGGAPAGCSRPGPGRRTGGPHAPRPAWGLPGLPGRWPGSSAGPPPCCRAAWRRAGPASFSCRGRAGLLLLCRRMMAPQAKSGRPVAPHDAADQTLCWKHPMDQRYCLSVFSAQ